MYPRSKLLQWASESQVVAMQCADLSRGYLFQCFNSSEVVRLYYEIAAHDFQVLSELQYSKARELLEESAKQPNPDKCPKPHRCDEAQTCQGDCYE